MINTDGRPTIANGAGDRFALDLRRALKHLDFAPPSCTCDDDCVYVDCFYHGVDAEESPWRA